MGKLTSILPALALGAAGAISTAAPSLADPVTYTMQFLGTGCVGDAAVTADCATNAPPTFTSATVTLTMENDTGNIMFDSSVTPPLYEINGTATVSISGVNGGAPATFADTMQFYTDSVSLVGVFDGSINPNPTPPPIFSASILSINSATDSAFTNWARSRRQRAR